MLELNRDRVKVKFTEDGAVKIGNVSEMEIAFHLDNRQFTKLKDRLGRVFAGTDLAV